MRILTAVLFVSVIAATAGCTGVAFGKNTCTSGLNCQLNATRSAGAVVIEGTPVPSVLPSPSFPAAAYAECETVGGTPDAYDPTGDGQYTYSCDSVYYVGTDGKNDYYTDIPVSGDSLTEAGTAGTGATESECDRGYYPDASTGDPDGIPGKWADPEGLCLPTASNDYEDQFSH